MTKVRPYSQLNSCPKSYPLEKGDSKSNTENFKLMAWNCCPLKL